MVSRVGSIIGDRSAELAEWVEVLKTVHNRKIQILSSPTINMRAKALGLSRSLGKLATASDRTWQTESCGRPGATV